MKKLVTLVAVMACVVVFGGCKEKFPTPTESFQAWMTAIEKCDVEGIKGGMTTESVEQLTQLSEQMKNFVKKPEGDTEEFDIFKEMCKGFNKGGDMEVISESIEGDEARVEYKTNGKQNSAPMVRTEKGWALDMARMMQEAVAAQMEKMKNMMPPKEEGVDKEPAAEAPAEAGDEAAEEPAAEAPAAEEPAAEEPAAEATK